MTVADTEVNEFLHKALKELLPSAGWLSEESANAPERLLSDWVWVVDPVDGTKEYVRGSPEFAVSVGLVYKHQPVLGGVLNPATGEGGVGAQTETVFWGMTGRENPAVELEETRVSVSRTELEDGVVTPYAGLVGSLVPVGSIAYKLLRVAGGVDDLTFSVQPKNEWDVCGGVALLQAVGKVYRRFDGRSNVFNQESQRIPSGAVATDSILADRFLEARLPLTKARLRGSGEPEASAIDPSR